MTVWFCIEKLQSVLWRLSSRQFSDSSAVSGQYVGSFGTVSKQEMKKAYFKNSFYLR